MYLIVVYTNSENQSYFSRQSIELSNYKLKRLLLCWIDTCTEWLGVCVCT
jgi:hypothetical protein